MNTLSTTKKSIICAICIALCYIFPMIFHVFGAGAIFCPMHIPVFICGLICGWPYGLMCGLTGPVISCVLTSMPPVAMLPSMIVELITYGVVSGLLITYIHTKNTYADLYICLITAIVCGRILSGIAKAVLFTGGNYSIAIWISSSVVTNWPGTLIQLIFIPSILVGLMKAHLIPQRYIKKM